MYLVEEVPGQCTHTWAVETISAICLPTHLVVAVGVQCLGTSTSLFRILFFSRAAASRLRWQSLSEFGRACVVIFVVLNNPMLGIGRSTHWFIINLALNVCLASGIVCRHPANPSRAVRYYVRIRVCDVLRTK